MILSLIQDKRGYLWIGTGEGLNRYDGIHFKNIKLHKKNSRHLTQLKAYHLLEAPDGLIWIGNVRGGLSFFDPQKNIVKKYHFKKKKNHPDVNFLTINKICKYKNSLWLSVLRQGLIQLDLKSGEWRWFNKDQRGLNSSQIYSILISKKEELWVGTFNSGINVLNLKKKGNFTQKLKEDNKGLPDNTIRAIWENREGQIWISHNRGVSIYDRKKETFEDPFKNIKKEKQYYRIVRCFFEDNNMYWIGTVRGLISFNKKTKRFNKYFFSEDEQKYNRNNDITSILRDRSGVLWIGTVNGLYKKSKYKIKFTSIPKKIEINNNNFNTVFSLIKVKNNTILAGTNKGISRLINTSGGYIVDKTLNHLNSFKLPVSAINEDIEGNIWIGTQNNGLYYYNEQKSKLSHYSQLKGFSLKLSGNYIHKIWIDNNEDLWIGTKDGLVFWNKKKNFSRVYSSKSQDLNSLTGNEVSDILRDNNGTLWVGTNWGLNKFDNKNKKFQSYEVSSINGRGLNSRQVSALFEDSYGKLWIGTTEGGLNLLNKHTQKFIYITDNDGLGSNMINSIIEDNQKNLWISTLNGISKLRLKDHRITNYSSDVDFPSILFYSNSCKDANGNLFFGGAKAILYFSPEEEKINQNIPEILITELKVDNLPVLNLDNYLKKGEIRLKSNVRSIHLEFSAMDFNNTSNNKYAYKINNIDDKWNYIGNTNYLNFTNLKPDIYPLCIKGSNNDGIWNEEGVKIKIIIPPYFWQTWWFRTIILLILFIFILKLHLYRISKIKLQFKKDFQLDKFFFENNITEKEKVVILLIQEGKSNKEIEELMFISYGTVKNHVYSIYKKLNIKRRAQLITIVNKIKNK